MTKVLFKVDITNENEIIAKGQGNMIQAGTEIDFKKIPERVETFIKMGVAEIKEEKKAAADKE